MKSLLLVLAFISTASLSFGSSPFPIIPPSATPFYVSDSFTLQKPNGSGMLCAPYTLYYPGVYHTDISFVGGSTVTVYVTNAEFTLVDYNLPSSHGINTDVMLGIYDISAGLDPSQVVYKGAIFGHSPYAESPMQLINNVMRGGASVTSRFSGGLEAPLVYKIALPVSWGNGPFMIGSRMQFNLGDNSILAAYQYRIQGAIIVQ